MMNAKTPRKERNNSHKEIPSQAEADGRMSFK